MVYTAGVYFGRLWHAGGAGGAFILVPILLLMYPEASPETITSISLAVVFFNCLSGSVAYAATKRIDYKSGLLFSIATVPGAILGTMATSYFKRGVFDALLGVVLIIAAIFIFVRPGPVSGPKKDGPEPVPAHPDRFRGRDARFLLQPLLGVGLELHHRIHVQPARHRRRDHSRARAYSAAEFPVHIATATSHFMLAIMALTATFMHIGTGGFAHGGVQRTIVLSVGMVIGAQLGAILSPMLRGSIIVRALAVALALVGFRLIWVASQASQFAK